MMTAPMNNNSVLESATSLRNRRAIDTITTHTSAAGINTFQPNFMNWS